jgi:hypothetical protein
MPVLRFYWRKGAIDGGIGGGAGKGEGGGLYLLFWGAVIELQGTLYAAQATSVINLELAPARFLFQKV